MRLKQSGGSMNDTIQPEALTQERLRELFEYRDGLLINKSIRRSQISIGSPAGGIDCKGYRKVRVDGRMYRAHRLVFLFHHGYLPEIVDHIDCSRSNDRIENLRSATKSENGMNRSGSYAKTGHRNVYKRGNKFQVHLSCKGVVHYIGTFMYLDAATAAAETARKQHFGDFA